MPIPDNIDFDKVATILLAEVTRALSGWLRGRPADEVALMNHVTGNLSKGRRGCDVGVTSRVKMVSQLALLHRKGSKQTDLYGSDLAVTVVIDETNFIKTALFQFKKGTEFTAVLERRQLNQAQIAAAIEQRSFVLYADEGRTGLRIKGIADLLNEFDSQQQTKTFNTVDWIFLVQWLWEWFSCNIGPISDPNDQGAVEPLLKAYVDQQDWVSPWGFFPVGADFSDDILPARAWLVLFFIREGADTVLAAKLK